MVPTRTETRLLDAVAPGWETRLEAAEERGIVHLEGETVAYRHELARRAVEESLPELRRRRLHSQVLAVLLQQGADPARLVHHAEGAGNHEVLARQAVVAARAAAAADAHREAFAHYLRAIDHLDHYTREEQAGLWEETAWEAYVTSRESHAREAIDRAVEMWEEMGDRRAEARARLLQGRIRWWTNDGDGAERATRRAVQILEELGDAEQLPMGCSRVAQLAMLRQEDRTAVEWAERALEAATAVGDDLARAHALDNLGVSLWRLQGEEAGRPLLEESLRLSLAAGMNEEASRAYTNIAWQLLGDLQLDDAEAILLEGLAFAEDFQMVGFSGYMTATLAGLRLLRGAWEEAEGLARRVLDQPGVPAVMRTVALTCLGRLQLRRGDPEAGSTLHEALRLAEATGEMQRLRRWWRRWQRQRGSGARRFPPSWPRRSSCRRSGEAAATGGSWPNGNGASPAPPGWQRSRCWSRTGSRSPGGGGKRRSSGRSSAAPTSRLSVWPTGTTSRP